MAGRCGSVVASADDDNRGGAGTVKVMFDVRFAVGVKEAALETADELGT